MGPMDDQVPVTKADFSSLRQEMDRRFVRMDEHLDHILDVVIGIDARLKKMENDHGRRITRLEKAVF